MSKIQELESLNVKRDKEGRNDIWMLDKCECRLSDDHYEG